VVAVFKPLDKVSCQELHDAGHARARSIAAAGAAHAAAKQPQQAQK
jgi:hypothetical protein